jgi:hypothetical protein
MSVEHFVRLDLSLTRGESILFDELKLKESAGFEELCSVTFPWTSYRADDVLLPSVGSTGLSKSTYRQYLRVSFIMDRDIFRCQKMQKRDLASSCI